MGLTVITVHMQGVSDCKQYHKDHGIVVIVLLKCMLWRLDCAWSERESFPAIAIAVVVVVAAVGDNILHCL
jgi:hypothetical protein